MFNKLIAHLLPYFPEKFVWLGRVKGIKRTQQTWDNGYP